MYPRVGLKREFVRFCAGMISFLFSGPPRRTILDKRRIDNQIGVHPFLCYHLIGVFDPLPRSAISLRRKTRHRSGYLAIRAIFNGRRIGGVV